MDEQMRDKFENWLRRNPDARFWNSSDAMFAAFIGGAALSQPAAAEPATNSEVELALFHINGDYGNKLKLSALRTGRALDAFAAGRAKATK